MEVRSLLKRLVLTAFLLNLLVGVYLYVDLEQMPNSSFLALMQAGRFEDAPPRPYVLTRAWRDYLQDLVLNRDHQGLINDDEYCKKVAEFRESHPIHLDSNGFPAKKDRIIYSDYKPGNLVKDVIKEIGVLAMPGHYLERPTSEYQQLELLDLDIVLFHQKTPQWHLYHRIGTHFLCPGQRYNHIPGHEHFVNKDEMADLNRAYGAYYEHREDCFDPWTFMPETLNLADPYQCYEFFKRVAADPDPGTIRWIKKKARNSHNAEGVEVVTASILEEMVARYDSGALCTSIREEYIVQHYIDNPLLLDNKKFDFRVYMLVASMDPLMILYHDGFLRVSLMDFDQKSNDTMAHVTNTQLAKNMLESKHASEKEWEDTMAKQMWSFPTFERHMVDQGVVEPGWIDEYVRRVMKEKMLHLTRMVSEQLLRHPGVYELFGVDFMFDENLNLWFLEVNRSPAMQATTAEKGRIQSKMIKDVLEIELALLTRKDLDLVVPNTGFQWVFDGRQIGMKRYKELLTQECV